ncbi:DNA cytosine methyltransferase [Brevibacterium limosum]|uniref:DNA cytosine methyltransferase n=1 Tax=Brevibacterium limosum TaxID=2697565 RepID=UPI001420B341|nr:DNA cytosine methyltransferase [Brevibacterium limosum]
MELEVLDLFTGAGGLTQGWHEAAKAHSVETRTVGAVELDPTAAATYRENFGDAGQFVGSIEDWLNQIDTPSADVILGGPPCQGFSKLGKRDINDIRNLLWKKYAETIVRAEPQYFVLENVIPFLSSSEYVAFRNSTLSGGLLQDYILEPHRLIATDYGAPQKRKRAVVIGRHKDLPQVGAPTVTHPDKKNDWVTVGKAFAGIETLVDGIHLPKRTSPEGFEGPYESRELHLGRTYTDLSLKRFANIPRNGNRFDIPDELLSPCWKRTRTGYSDVMGRLDEDSPSVTIRTEFDKPEKGRYLHPTAHRAITHFEAARLQGFPDDFKWLGSKPKIARQIGNAVPVQLARAVSERIIFAAKGLLPLSDDKHEPELPFGPSTGEMAG